VKFHLTIDQCEQGVIATHADIIAGMEFSAALTHENITGNYCFSAVFFHAETATDCIATVA
tara:strand:- start:98 stop:280 length:183 start_codon:yes stop_codon:yes gene_type:complete